MTLTRKPHLIWFLLVLWVLMSVQMTPALAQSSAYNTDFETGFTVGNIHGQNNWSKSLATLDHEITQNTTAPSAFGNYSLRISNAQVNAGFNNHTFTPGILYAGESTAQPQVQAPFLEIEFQFTSAAPTTYQQGLSVTLSASPYASDGRMNWLGLSDETAGLAVQATGYQNNGFPMTTIASGLARNAVHTVRMTTVFVDNAQPQGDVTGATTTHDGINNDIVCIWINNQPPVQISSWENFYRDSAPTYNQPGYNLNGYTPAVNSFLFRTAGTAAPATQGNGLLFDNFRISTGLIPAGMENGCTPSSTPSTSSASSASRSTAQTNIDCDQLATLTYGAISASGTFGNVSNGAITGNTYCRVIAQDGQYLQSPAEIGKSEVIALNALQAVDLFGMLPGGYPHIPFTSPVQVCLRGEGTPVFINAADQARTIHPLSTVSGQAGYTCTLIHGSGTVALVGDSLPASQPSAPTTDSQRSLNQCRVTLLYTARLRQAPSTDGSILNRVPYALTLDATAEQNGWYQVIFEDTQGWVRGDLVRTAGGC